MVSGVEAAGLVLATFPLVIEGLKVYLRGAETITSWWGDTLLIDRLILRVDMEWLKFRSSLEVLLLDLFTAEELESALETPDFFGQKDIQSSLSKQLGTSFRVFSATVAEMIERLEELKAILELNDDGRPIWAEGGSSLKRGWKRLRLTLSEEKIDSLLDRLRRSNFDLQVLMERSKQVESQRAPKLGPAKYDRIQDHARTLYSALDCSLTRSCGCLVAHTASLQLEDKSTQGDRDHRPKFNVLFSFEPHSMTQAVPWNWCDTVIESLDGEDPRSSGAPQQNRVSGSMSAPAITQTIGDIRSPPATASRFSLTKAIRKRRPRDPRVRFEIPLGSEVPASRMGPGRLPISERVECLCAAIGRKIDETPHLGLLTAATSSSRQHSISLTGVTFCSNSTRTVSLTTLLSRILERKYRLSLAVKLASTLLQLYKTPWLDEMWGKQDVFFVEQQGDSSDSILQKPYVSRPFPPPTCPPQQTLVPCRSVRSQSTFGLGVLLIELWYGKTLEDLRVPADATGHKEPNQTTDWLTATRLLNDIYLDAGDAYGNAVRRCLNFDFNQLPPSLETRAVKEAMHQGVVMPIMSYMGLFHDNKLDGCF
ncbi:MAG: hypothetical protein M1840_000953 [Geoglossum simile]|nr:MAG: hypothetical protein M1840_000953 [Geoglossum simile]